MTACIASSSSAFAQSSGSSAPSHARAEDDDLARAKARYAAGATAFSEQRWKDAIDLFLSANEIKPVPAFSYNIALAYESMGDTEQALRWYRDFVRRSGRGADLGDAPERIVDMESRLQQKGVQQVTILSDPEGATVRIDDRPVGITPWTGELAPGRHRATVSLTGHEGVDREFELFAHRALDVTVELEEHALAPSQPAPPVARDPIVPDAGAPQSEPRVRWPTWTLLGTGAATLATGGVFEALRAKAEGDVSSSATQVEAASHIDTMERRQRTARALAGVGGALLVSGGVLLFVDLTRRRDPAADRATAGIGWVDGGCALTAKGRF